MATTERSSAPAFGTPVAAGELFRIEVRDHVARCRVWSNPLVSVDEGAREAALVETHLTTLVRDPRVQGALLDLRDGPVIAGPRTQASLRRIFRQFDRASRAVAVAVGDSALQRMQMARLVKGSAPRLGKVLRGLSQAEAWLSQQIDRANSAQTG